MQPGHRVAFRRQAFTLAERINSVCGVLAIDCPQSLRRDKISLLFNPLCSAQNRMAVFMRRGDIAKWTPAQKDAPKITPQP
jgi:hypothetical protein